MSIKYRKLNIEDAERFWNMMFLLDKETDFMMFEPNERPKNLELIKNIISNAIEGDNFLLVAQCNEEIVGYISAQKGSLNRIKHSAYTVVGVRNNYRGKGIGTEFFKRLNEWAKEKNISRLELTVMCNNTSAKHLYDKNGFVVEGIKKNSMVVKGKFIDEFYMAKIF